MMKIESILSPLCLLVFVAPWIAPLTGAAAKEDKILQGKVSVGGTEKGATLIAPNQCINGELAQGDDQLELDNTFIDEYTLNWPGGGIEISLSSNAFDEYLWVFRPSGSETEVDTTVGTPTEVFSRENAVAGTYTIWVNSYEVDTGPYQLCVSAPSDPCEPAAAPTGPIPADTASEVPVNVELTWNNPAKNNKVLYGDDDRMEVYQVTDPGLLNAYQSTVTLVEGADITDNGNGTYTLDNIPFTSAFVGETSMPVCSDEPFRGQPKPGFCSGFLVAPDLVATAGHCVLDDLECEDTFFVFGFQMLDANTPVLTVPDSDVYRCAGIYDRVQSEFTGEDWALIRLDRPVVGHDPLPIRREGTIANSQGLVLIGNPVGLPTKIAGGANVRDNGDPIFFRANIDSYAGNSGGVVLNANTLAAEGILVRGETDFMTDGNCARSVRCPDNGCQGEDVTRITLFDELIPEPLEYDVYFGACGNLQFLGTTQETSWPLTGLAANTTFCWRIDAVNECSTVPGPVWRFTTAGAGVVDYDVDDNNQIDAHDLLGLMEMGMLGENNLFGFAMIWKTMQTKVIPSMTN